LQALESDLVVDATEQGMKVEQVTLPKK